MFISDNRKEYCVPNTFKDYFIEYLGFVEKQEKLAKTIPLDHMDQLLAAAQDNIMAYCILVLLQRVGMTSTDIIELKHPISRFMIMEYMHFYRTEREFFLFQMMYIKYWYSICRQSTRMSICLLIAEEIRLIRCISAVF